ncbi:MAG: hypothetical protein H0W34_09680 [Pyrinomonadaceae bacterium]|nr:hypothetical protein [Pyrinomonadaceae bacterium]
MLICLVVLIMAILALPISRHETVAYSRALGAFHDAPGDATRQALAQITAEEDRALVKAELILCVPLVAASVTVGLITRRLRTRTI